jgi:hypothetical protein
MKSFLSTSKWLQYYLPASLTLFMLVTLKRAVITDGGYDRLYGFPFPYISNNNGCTGCYLVFIGAMMFDLFFYLTFIFLVFNAIEKLGLKLKTHWILTIIGMLISSQWIFFFFVMTHDSTFNIKSDTAYKTLHSEFVFDQTP